MSITLHKPELIKDGANEGREASAAEHVLGGTALAGTVEPETDPVANALKDHYDQPVYLSPQFGKDGLTDFELNRLRGTL